MDGKDTTGTLMEALTRFETVGMPARNLAVRTRREYSRDLHALTTSRNMVSPQWRRCASPRLKVTWLS